MSRRRSAARFARTPKGVLLIVLLLLAVTGTVAAGFTHIAPVLLGAIVPACVVDTGILRVRKKRWIFPDGALLTALIVAMILAPEERWYVAASSALIAIASKYLLRGRKANIFNPAAFGLVATFYIFGPAHNWWGALPDLGPVALAGLLATGIFVALRVNKAPAVLSFLAAYYLLVTAASYMGDPAAVAELYRTPDLQAALFFAFFMVSDPPTSPPAPRDQLWFGAIAAVASVIAFEVIGAAYFLLTGVLVANVHEGWRRGRLEWRTQLKQVRGVPTNQE